MEGASPTRADSTCSSRSFPVCRLVTEEEVLDEVPEHPNCKGSGFRSAISGNRTSRQVVNGHIFLIDEEHWLGRARMRASNLLESRPFDKAIGVVIIANSVCIGVELSYQLDGKPAPILDILEHVFLSVYTLELGLRFFVQRQHCLKDNWVRFDCVLVFVGATTTWAIAALELLLSEPHASLMSDPDSRAGSVKMLMVLRIMRIVRLARTMRLLVKFHSLGTLVRGLLASGSTMFYTVLLLITLLYVFACTGIQLVNVISLDVDVVMDVAVEEIIEMHFSSVPIAMLTLVQFVCLDSIASIYTPLCQWDLRFTVYFMSCILVIGIVLMNLITAVVVEGAMEQASQDKEALEATEDMRKRRLIRDLRKMFIRLDEDESGCVSQDEIKQLTNEDRALLSNVMTTTDPEEIFAAIDVDNSGTIDIDEFCDGIWQVAISKAPIEIKRLEKYMQKLIDSAAREESMRDVFLGELREIKMLLVGPSLPPPGCEVRSLNKGVMLSPVPEGRKHGAFPGVEPGDASVVRNAAGSPGVPWAQELTTKLQEAADACGYKAQDLQRISESDAGFQDQQPPALGQIPEDPPSPPKHPLNLEAPCRLNVLPLPPALIGYYQECEDGPSTTLTCSALEPENPRRVIKPHLTAAQRQLMASQRARQNSA